VNKPISYIKVIISSLFADDIHGLQTMVGVSCLERFSTSW